MDYRGRLSVYICAWGCIFGHHNHLISSVLQCIIHLASWLTTVHGAIIEVGASFIVDIAKQCYTEFNSRVHSVQ